MLERFVKQTKFTSQEDFIKNLKIEVPENFNFGYDVVDAWAAELPDKNAILLTERMYSLSDYCFSILTNLSNLSKSRGSAFTSKILPNMSMSL